jgi:Leucine-rich repeat (LRR) protein
MSQANSPFKFLDSYQQQDADIFFGRERETDALYHALSGVKHLLVHGPSGAGKTSLIECGLCNQFSDADWFALSIRRGQNMTASVFEKINGALGDKIALDPNTKLPTDSDMDFGQAIDRLFAERFQPVYLLFDQFEELLLLGSEDEKRDFFTRLHQLIRYKVPCRVLLVMREEFIGHLSEWEHLCPSVFQHRFRLEKMGRSNVRQVLQNILEAPKYQSNFRVEQPDQLADSILAKLPDTQREIDLTHVQVFLGELWDRAVAADPGAAQPLLQRSLVKSDDNLERVLDSFLKKQLEELARIHGEKAPLELLAAMISERHTKLQVSAADLQQHLAHNHIALQQPLPELLRDMEEHRILRALKSGEVTQYEITHDVLAKVVGDNLTPNIKMRKDADKIYQVYLGQVGLFSEDVVNRLRALRDYLNYPKGLEEKIVGSERYLREQKKLATKKEREELEKAQRQALDDGILRANAEKGQKRALRFAWLAGTLALVAIFITYWAMKQAKEANFAKIKTQEMSMIARIIDSKKYISRDFNFEIKLDDKQPVSSIERAFESMIEDRENQLRNEPISSFHQAVIIAKQIERLNLSKLALTYVDTNIFSLKNLIILNLDHNDITIIPEQIGKLKNLKSLSIYYNKLSVLPISLSNLDSLQDLDIGSNKLSDLPLEIQKLQNLENLSLSYNPIYKIDFTKLENLPKLKYLSLSGCNLNEIPSTIENLQNLQRLNLSYNNFTELPPSIGNLHNLHELDLSGNKLTKLPVEISNLHNLHELNLRENKLTKLPVGIGNLHNLHELDLSGNFLNDLPTEFENFASFKNLKKLCLGDMNLVSIPTCIYKIQNLDSLELILFSNKISTIPPEIGSLNKLLALDLSNNLLSDLPVEFANMKKLQKLDLSGNQFKKLPIQILMKMPNLKTLILKSFAGDNPLKIKDIEDLHRAMPWCEIEGYYFFGFMMYKSE